MSLRWLLATLLLLVPASCIVNNKSVFNTNVNLGLLGWANDQPFVNGDMFVSMTSVLPNGKSELLKVQLPLPLGIDLEQSPKDGIIRVVSVSGKGSAKNTEETVKVGDILRAVTARVKKMSYPQQQVALGGIGRPQLATTILFCERRRDLDEILDGLASNLETADAHPDDAMRIPGIPTLLLERAL